MKPFVKIIVALSLLSVCFTHASAQSKYDFKQDDYRGLITVNNTLFAERDDELHVVIDVWVSGRGVQNYAAICLTPKLVAKDNSYLLPQIMIRGANKRKTYNRWERTMSRKQRSGYQAPWTVISVRSETDTTITYSVSIPYELWMDDAVLALNEELIEYRDQRSMIVIAMGGQVALEAKVPYRVQPQVEYVVPLVEQKSRKRQGQAFLDFQVGRSNIVPTYRRNPEELEKIRMAFAEIVSNPDVTVNGLFIEGYASPEGRYAMNDRLSAERSSALKDYIVNNFNLPIGAEHIRTSSVAEDWDGLRSLILAGEMARKEQVISIIDNTADPDQREAKLRGMGGGIWQLLLRDYLPGLRRVEYQIDFSVRDYSVSEAKNMLGKGDMLLSQRELFQAAMSYGESSEEFDNIVLNIIPRYYPDDTTAGINAAAIMIRKGETATAKRLLEKMTDVPAAWNNLAVIYMMEEHLDEAQALLQRAAEAGVKQAEHNLREIKTKRSDNIRMSRYVK